MGIGTNTAMPGELAHPVAALLGCPTSAASTTEGLGSQQEPPLHSPYLEGLSPETGNAAGESEEGTAGHGDLAASEEGSEHLTSVSGAKAAPARLGQQQGSVPGMAMGCVPVRLHPSQSHTHGCCSSCTSGTGLGVWWLLLLFSLFVSFVLSTPFPPRPLTGTGKGALLLQRGLFWFRLNSFSLRAGA